MSAYSIRTVASSVYDANTGGETAIIPQTHSHSTKAPLKPHNDDAQSYREHIGPIARLNPDELMLIFELSAEVYWTAPLSISRVCREWRSIILATPRAWTNLHLPARPSFNIISLYINRSQPFLLHLRTPGDTTYHWGADSNNFFLYIKVIDDISQRVECLTILSRELPLLTGRFPSLRRLRLSRRRPSRPVDVSVEIDFSMFPGICHLDFDGVKAPPVGSYSTPMFPDIQQLALWTDSERRWHGFVEFVAKDLVSLHVRVKFWRGGPPYSTPIKPLYLQVLRYLHLVDDGYETWEFVANTPSLISYIPLGAFSHRRRSYSPRRPASVSVDVARVTHLRLLEDVNLSPYPALRYLQICFPLENIIQRLEHNPNICQDLETIEWLIDHEELPMATKMDRKTRGVTKQLQIIKTTAWNLEFPYHISREVSLFASLEKYTD
jgi:hypothetical protein